MEKQSWALSRILVFVLLIICSSFPLLACATPTPAPTEQLGHKLVVVYGSELGTLNLYTVAAADYVLRNIYEPLVDKGLNGEPVPRLATSWEQIEPTRWRLYLRQGVKFHDGSTFTSQDVVDALNWNLELKGVTMDYCPMSGAEAVDEYTVDITLPGPDPLFPEELFFFPIYPSSITKDNPELAETTESGTGPYEVVEWKRGDRLVLKYFEDYWGSKPQMTDVEVLFREEASVRVAMLRTGEAQLIYGVPPELTTDLPKSMRWPSNETWALLFDTYIQAELGGESLLADERLRKAIDYAIDRQTLADTLYEGYASPARAQVGKPGYFGYDPNLEDYPYDLEKAKALVREAGAEGKVLTFIGTSGRWAKDREFNEAVAAMIEQTGLKVDLQFPEFGEWQNYAFVMGERRNINGDIVSLNTSLDTHIAEVFLKRFLFSEGSLSRVKDPQVDAMWKEVEKEATAKVREQKGWDLLRYNKDHSYTSMLIGADWIWGLAENLDWQPTPDCYPAFATMRYTD